MTPTATAARLRQATADDLDVLIPLINAAYTFTESHVFGGTQRAGRHDITRLVDDIAIAEIDDRIAGCVHIEATRDPAHFGLLAVDVSRHRSGLGSLLVSHAEAVAVDASATVMRIETVKQAGLVPFYERLGYRVVGESDGQVWNGGADWGAIIPWQMVDMEKRLR